MEDTMVLINQSFDLDVLCGGHPPSSQFDQDMEVFDARL